MYKLAEVITKAAGNSRGTYIVENKETGERTKVMAGTQKKATAGIWCAEWIEERGCFGETERTNWHRS
jgi:hypothetical protein